MSESIGDRLSAMSSGERLGSYHLIDDGCPPSRTAEIGGGDSSLDNRRRIDEYCSRVDDELRASESRYPMVGLVVLALASVLEIGLLGALLKRVLEGP